MPSLRLANGRVGAAQSEEEIRSALPLHRLARDDSVKVSIENTNTCSDSLVTAFDDDTLLINDLIINETMLYHPNSNSNHFSINNNNNLSKDKDKDNNSKVHFGIDEASLYGTPKEEMGPAMPGSTESNKHSFLRSQLQALFQPTDNKLAMKLFGSKKALMKERIRQKAAGHWVIHPCSSFR